MAEVLPMPVRLWVTAGVRKGGGEGEAGMLVEGALGETIGELAPEGMVAFGTTDTLLRGRPRFLMLSPAEARVDGPLASVELTAAIVIA